MKSEIDIEMMQRALDLATNAITTARPNPMVGCVITQNDEIIDEGIHWQAGLLHAERVALSSERQYQGATCYVTLEPCSHYGRTPPCVDAIIESGISRVVIASQDPNPQVSGKGIEALKQAGLRVEVGLLEKEAKKMNIGFFSRMIRKRPYVRAKVGMSLDAKVAMKNGESQWITNEASRLYGHRLRAQSGAVLTSHATVKRDNCQLTVRGLALPKDSLVAFEQPLRVIVDAQLNTPTNAAIFEQPGETVVVVSEKLPQAKIDTWLKQRSDNDNVDIIRIQSCESHVDLTQLLQWLGEIEINDLFIESGPGLLGAMIQQNLVDELYTFVAPKLLGSDAHSMVNLPGVKQLSENVSLKFTGFEQLENDLLITSTLTNFLDV